MARNKKGLDLNGWLIIDKPKDVGSTDVVSKTRYLLNANKNGHTGTLDPFATGVLPIAFGEATKLVSIVTDGMKEYEFIIQFGVATTSDDTEGEIVATSQKVPAEAELKAILPQFVGKIMQQPSQYSAIKINGKRAYDLAREGIKVEMPKREIEIYNLELLAILPNNQAHLKVSCSKGTYVRTLGKDIAEKLGSLGHLIMLRRTKCGVFELKDTILLEDLKNMRYIAESLLPMETYLRDIAVIAITEIEATKLKQGQGLSPQNFDFSGQAIASCNGKLVAIIINDGRRISPVRVFNY